jgi:hypothetical protein
LEDTRDLRARAQLGGDDGSGDRPHRLAAGRFGGALVSGGGEG